MKNNLILLFIICILNCCITTNENKSIIGTWYSLDIEENDYLEYGIFENKLYSNSKNYGFVEKYYKIENDSLYIFTFDYQDTIKYKYLIKNEKVFLTNNSIKDTLFKSLTQVEEDEYQFFTYEELHAFEDRFWERMQINLNN